MERIIYDEKRMYTGEEINSLNCAACPYFNRNDCMYNDDSFNELCTCLSASGKRKEEENGKYKRN